LTLYSNCFNKCTGISACAPIPNDQPAEVSDSHENKKRGFSSGKSSKEKFCAHEGTRTPTT
ncbi:hypothetical protein, partial [uncultured Duncaniella sp.]